MMTNDHRGIPMKTGKIDLSEMAKEWGGPLVARSRVADFSGGLLNPRTLANHDSKGTGPRGKIRCGRLIAYRVEELVRWMEERAEEVPSRRLRRTK